jgi:hypothetical protein
MAQPNLESVHTDAILTNISVAYIQKQEHFIASKVFPLISVDKKSDSYYIYTQADWFRDEARVRGDASESAGGGYTLSTATYTAVVFSFHKDVGDQVVQNSDDPLNPMQDATRFITQKLLLRQEIQWVSDYFVTSVWANDTTPTNTWDDYASSDPIDDIELGKETILKNTGFMPNKLVLGYEVFRKLKHHPDIIDRIKYTTNAATNMVTAQLLAALFEVDEVLVARAIKNSSNEGQTASYAFTHGKNALLAYAPARPGLLEPAAGYTFGWRGISDGLGTTVGISRFRMPELRADRIEGQMAWDNKVVATNLGYFFDGAVA